MKHNQPTDLGPCHNAEKAVEHESDGDTSCNWFALNGS